MKPKEPIQTKTKEEIIKILDANQIPYIIMNQGECESIFIPLDDIQNNYFNIPIAVQTSRKEIRKVFPHEILYISIENRKSVLYLIDEKLETNYPLLHWKLTLDEKNFAQPHYSYIVNLNYVDEVTRDFVKIKSRNVEYLVYVSSRKSKSFRKAFLNFKDN